MNGSALGRARITLVSAAAKESALGAGATIDTAFSVSGGPPKLVFETFDNADLANGVEEPTTQDVTTHYVRIPSVATTKATPNMLAFLACAVLGLHTHTSSGGAATHTITPQVVTNTLCETFSAECLDIVGVQYQYDGVAANNLTLSGSRGGFLTLESELLGCGKYTAATHTGTEATDEPILHMKDCKVWFGAGSYAGATVTQAQASTDLAGSPGLVSATLESIRWMPSKNMDPAFGFTVGGGTTWTRAERGVFGQTLEFTLLMTQDDLALIANQTQCVMQVKGGNPAKVINAGAKWYGFSLIFPWLQVKDYEPSGGPKDRMTVKFTVTVMSDPTYGSVKLTVWNKIATYLQ